jgi:hypothetical protein
MLGKFQQLVIACRENIFKNKIELFVYGQWHPDQIFKYAKSFANKYTFIKGWWEHGGGGGTINLK